jgi:UDP-N-acetylglucosamine--N-acetylmuramyl-(pentapeptide) pyrophosphoryl-undecaprenol N-acetylglucosamine transferase
MRIIAAGGGSGGHVTPVLAVINELKKQLPAEEPLEVIFLCDRGFFKQASTIMELAQTPVIMKHILSGKLRRYNTLPWWKYITHPSIMAKNLRDSFLMVLGTVQSVGIMLRYRPQVVFTKGGFVCVPIGFAARLCRIPLVIHDSDAHPGLTNRLLSRFASAIATGYPLEHYSYPQSRSYYVGIPISTQYTPVSSTQKTEIRKMCGLPDSMPLILITGGGLGAVRLNNAVIESIRHNILDTVALIHVTGNANFKDIPEELKQQPHYYVYPFVDSTVMASYIKASDIVVTRAGATTLLELAAAAKPIIIVPNPMLTGGHQLKNAEVYAGRDAAIVLDEKRIEQMPELLAQSINSLLASPQEQERLSYNIHQLAKPDAAKDMVRIIIKAQAKR